MSETTQYTPLALKFRPKKFADLKGQDVLVKTLSAAIIHSRLSHAYLLTGIRGVGKTTSARIIASIVNCENPVISGMNIEACTICNNCTSLAAGNHPDIIEIDAASRTSVDDVRSIIDSSEYRALLGKYKVFIIDEVHMISKNAFNALLKTLEEPPANVMFIFATTEVNKIPVTIISRCQRFDLRRFNVDEIIHLLQNIAKNESIQYDDDALSLIALKSGGSARDGISMLDQAWMLSETHDDKKVNINLVRSMLGISSLDVVVDFVGHIASQNVESALKLLQSINVSGSDLVYFFENILDIIGYLSKISTITDYSEPEFKDYHQTLKAMTDKLHLGILTIFWQIIFKGIVELKYSHNQLLSAEMLAIRIIYASLLPTPKEAIENLGDCPRQ
jgi:DNA polymerase-3 subunit gamma/tau